MTYRASIPCGEDAPDLFELHRRHPADYPFLLQSVAGGGRYDILFARPKDVLRTDAAGFFDALNAAAASARVPEQDVPFIGGWFLLLGYELVAGIEPSVKAPASPYRWPSALAVRCAAAVIYDRPNKTLELVAEDAADLARLETEARSLAALGMTLEKIECLVEHCEEEPPQRFLDGIRRIHDYLLAGDVFQVNLSRGWKARLKPARDYLDVYAQLRRCNPAPFAGLAVWDGIALLSSSPERLVELSEGRVQTRPIAGTHARESDQALDESQKQKLLASFKERAEHIMLIDLERNDLGRVCVPGSISVDELMQVESYAHVHHIVSNLRGQLRTGAGPGDVLRAVFPGGTITGCPKVRAMQIIAELESAGRGPYTGAMGYLSRDGRMDLNILIRSLACEGRELGFRTGAGIVADSDPESELAETRAKARGMLRALGL